MLGQRGEEVLALPDGFSLTKQDRAVPFPLATVTPGAGYLLPLLTKGFPIRAGTFVPTEVTVTSGLARLKHELSTRRMTPVKWVSGLTHSCGEAKERPPQKSQRPQGSS